MIISLLFIKDGERLRCHFTLHLSHPSYPPSPNHERETPTHPSCAQRGTHPPLSRMNRCSGSRGVSVGGWLFWGFGTEGGWEPLLCPEGVPPIPPNKTRGGGPPPPIICSEGSPPPSVRRVARNTKPYEEVNPVRARSWRPASPHRSPLPMMNVANRWLHQGSLPT